MYIIDAWLPFYHFFLPNLFLPHVRRVMISQYGWTALLLAAELGHLSVVQWLTGLGADAAAKTKVDVFCMSLVLIVHLARADHI